MPDQTNPPRQALDVYKLEATRLLTEDQTAAILQVSPGTLSVWRSTGRYNLPFVKIGRKVRYRAGDLRQFIESRLKTHTGQA
jgi:hypothetical protein